MKDRPTTVDQLWDRSRAGSHAGRGFHYQDAVAAELAVAAWSGALPITSLTPEGLEDVSLLIGDRKMHLQAKSRREHRGAFSEADLTEAWRHVAARLRVDPSSNVGLILERPLRGVQETGYDRTLSDVADQAFRRSIAAAVRDEVEPERFLTHAHLIVMPASPLTSIERLADRLATSPAVCAAHHALILAHVADLADQNGTRRADESRQLTIADIEKMIERATETIDSSALEEAVRSGAAELADFRTAVNDPNFYGGVDVVAGHVVAGLTVQRDELVGELQRGLGRQSLALAVGPSGSGKSALLWLTAFATRLDIRWYRVQRLDRSDVTSLIRLARGYAPTGARIGFLVDDLGDDNRNGFDDLVTELRHQPQVCVLGASREEDLFAISSAPSALQVHPRLDEALAKRIWQELRANGTIAIGGWREAFARSEGLLLEYTHLLTEGARLEQTLEAQVDRRLREDRGAEIDVLALVATAHSFGGEVPVGDAAAQLKVGNSALRAALARLLDEHLLAERDGLLRGLHELRSRYLMALVHRIPPPVLEQTIRSVVDLVDAARLQPVLVRMLRARPVDDEVIIDALAQRVEREHDPAGLAAALHALRLVDASVSSVC